MISYQLSVISQIGNPASFILSLRGVLLPPYQGGPGGILRHRLLPVKIPCDDIQHDRKNNRQDNRRNDGEYTGYIFCFDADVSG